MTGHDTCTRIQRQLLSCKELALQVLIFVCLFVPHQAKILPSYSRMFQNVPECTKMFQNVPECSRMFLNVPECSKMFQNVTEFYRILQNVTECYRIFQIFRMFQNSCRFMSLYAGPWACMQFHKLTWSYISLHAYPQACMQFPELT